MAKGFVTVSTQYTCPECGIKTAKARAWQTAMAELRRHRKEHYGEAFGKMFSK